MSRVEPGSAATEEVGRLVVAVFLWCCCSSRCRVAVIVVTRRVSFPLSFILDVVNLSAEILPPLGPV